MITIILHHTALELINQAVCNVNHKAILNDAKRRNKKVKEIVLDISVHQAAIYPNELPFTGRPDLVHYFLLQYHHMMKILPESITENITLYIHTRTDEIFLVPQSWRVPVHFIRFRGLIESLLIQKEIKFSEKDSIIVEKLTLSNLFLNVKPSRIINLTDKGDYNPQVIKNSLDTIRTPEQVIFLIGGYQKGELSLDQLVNYPIENIKLIEKSTTAWMALTILFSKILSKIEN